MTVDLHSATAVTADDAATPLGAIKSLTLTVDEGWSPYIQGTIVVADDGLSTFNPQRPTYVQLELKQDFSTPWPLSDFTADWQGNVAAITAEYGGRPLSAISADYTTSFDGGALRASTFSSMFLMLRNRRANRRTGEVTYDVASRDMELQDTALVSTSAVDFQVNTVRQLATQVLQRIGMYLNEGTADGDVPVDATWWEPGISAWDFLSGPVEQAGLRLWADEGGWFNLTDAEAPATGTARTLTDTFNVINAEQVASRDTDSWFDSVVIKYTWLNRSTGQPVTRYDAAQNGFPTKTLLIERSTPYPGKGGAAKVLKRRQTRALVQPIDAVSDYTVRPGQPINLTLAGKTTGHVVTSVQWALPQAEMIVTLREPIPT